MHELALARAALPAPTVCLGMLLRPYSLGHELWLYRESNSVLRGSKDGLPGAVLICCQTWDQLRTMRNDPFLGLKLWIWKHRIGIAAKNAKNAKNSSLSAFSAFSAVKDNYLEQELAKFLAYRDEGLLEFPISKLERPGRGPAPRLPGTPFILRLQQWLMTHFRLTEAQAWDYPAGLAKMRWAAHWEAEGGLDVFNAHDAEESDFVALCEAHGGPSAVKKLREKGLL